MKTAKLYFLPILFLVLSSGFILKSISVRKDAALLSAKVSHAEAAAPEATGLTQSDILVLNNTIVALAKSYNVPLESQVSEASLTYSSTKEALSNYDGIMKLLTDIGQLPWPIRYQTMCIGTMCPKGFDFQISFERKKVGDSSK